jgi:ankyrin repeat protein
MYKNSNFMGVMNKLNLFIVALISCMGCTVAKANNCYNQTFLHLLAGACVTDYDHSFYGMNSEAFLRLRNLFSGSSAMTHNDIAVLAGQENIDINQRDSFGAAAIHYAAMVDYSLFEWLLKNGASPYIVDNGGWNILHYAIATGAGIGWDTSSCINIYVDVTKLVNQQDENGDTPLHVAVYNHQTFCAKYSGKRELFIINTLRDDCVRWLLEYGADASICNNEGYTPADCIKMDYDANECYGQYLLQLIESN